MSNTTEHLIFAAMLIPTFVVLSAAGLSLAPLDTSVIARPPVMMLACAACLAEEQDGY